MEGAKIRFRHGPTRPCSGITMWAQSRRWITDLGLFVDVDRLGISLTVFLRRVLTARKPFQFCAKRDPLVKRIIFYFNFKHFYKKRKKLAPPKVKKYFWSRSKNRFFIFIQFSMKNFEKNRPQNFRSQNFHSKWYGK